MEEMGRLTILDSFRGKRIFITGHTGFKGTWLSYILNKAGALVTGFALEPESSPNMFELLGIGDQITSLYGDIRDYDALWGAFCSAEPEYVIHLAAQPIVRESYKRPVYTYETNVMGTVNILECVRRLGKVRSFLNVTTDKVYENNEWEWGYRENDKLDGFDPYSNSKSCSDLITHCYRRSFFDDTKTAVSTVRAGNVIGGGDFAKARIIPDCVRAALSGQTIEVRNPASVRPYQHVLEPLFAYLMILGYQCLNPDFSGCYNIGPSDDGCVTTRKLVEIFCNKWGEGVSWSECSEENAPHESNILRLDCSRIRNRFGWEARWNVDLAVKKTVEWYKCLRDEGDLSGCTSDQIEDYMNYKHDLRETQYAGES